VKQKNHFKQIRKEYPLKQKSKKKETEKQKHKYTFR